MKAKIFNFIQNLFFILSVIICAFIIAQKFFFKENGLLGYRTFVIVTKSMSPHLEVGDVIVVKNVDKDTIKEGDIVTYQGKESDFKGKIVTHMVKTIDKDDKGKYLFYTKGTVTNMVDPVVKEDQIYGKMVFRFYLISLISKLIRSKLGFVVLIFIPLIIILIKQLLTIKKEVKKDPTTEEWDKLIKDFKKKNSVKYSLIKKKKKNKEKIIEIKNAPTDLEKTVYSEEFKKEIERELEKTMVNINLKDEIERENNKKIKSPSKGLENTLINSKLNKEIENFEMKVPEIILIED